MNASVRAGSTSTTSSISTTLTKVKDLVSVLWSSCSSCYYCQGTFLGRPLPNVVIVLLREERSFKDVFCEHGGRVLECCGDGGYVPDTRRSGFLKIDSLQQSLHMFLYVESFHNMNEGNELTENWRHRYPEGYKWYHYTKKSFSLNRE